MHTSKAIDRVKYQLHLTRLIALPCTCIIAPLVSVLSVRWDPR